MNSWIIISMIGSMIGSFWNLSLKKGLLTSSTEGYTFYFCLFSFLIVSFINFFKGESFKLYTYPLIGGVCIALANIFFLKGVNLANNPGLPMAILRCQAILSFVLSHLIFGGKIYPHKIIGIILGILGVFIIVTGKNQSSNNNSQDSQKSKKKNKTLWIWYAIIAGILSTVNDLTGKKSFNTYKNITSMHMLFILALTQVIVIGIYKYYTTGKLYMTDKKKDRAPIKNYLFAFLTSIFYIGFVLCEYVAFSLAPNVGYVKSIDALGLVQTVILSKYLFKAPINFKSWMGVLTTISGIILVAI